MGEPEFSSQTSSEGRVLLMAMGFGQGTGTMLATESALLMLHDRFAGLLRTGDPRVWNSNALRTIEYARALGTLAAFSAARRQQCVIDDEAVQYALGGLGGERSYFLLGPCGC